MSYTYHSSNSFTDLDQHGSNTTPLLSNSSTPQTYSGEFAPINHSYMVPSPTENIHYNISPVTSGRFYPPSTSMDFPSSNSPYHEQILTPSVPLPSPLVDGLSVNNLPDIYEVHFKRTMDLFVRGFTESFNVGDFVKVEADRGFDLGVIAVLLVPGAPNYPYHSIPRRRVLSLANDEEKAFLLAKIEEEYRALDICRELAARRQMKINVLDAELQFDRRKLTFLFTSEKHTDFRELVRDLFSIFKTRIWMQKINPAQAASLEEDCKNSRFPTLPMNLALNREKYLSETSQIDVLSPRYNVGSPAHQVSSPVSSPVRGSPKLHTEQHPHRSSSITSTGSASTYEEEDEDDAYLADRARRVGGIRGIRDGEHLSISYAGSAGTRTGVRSLGALQLPGHSVGPHANYSRMAHSLPHGLEAQAVYSLGPQYQPPSRSNSSNSDRSQYELQPGDSGRSISLPTALPSHHWSTHPSDSASTTNASNSVSSVENLFHHNLTQYAGIPISSRQLKQFEMQQQRYLNEKYSHSALDYSEAHHQTGPDSIFSQISTVPDILIDDIQISLPNIEDSNEKIPNYFPMPGPPPTYSPTKTHSTRNFTPHSPIDITIQTNQNH